MHCAEVVCREIDLGVEVVVDDIPESEYLETFSMVISLVDGLIKYYSNFYIDLLSFFKI